MTAPLPETARAALEACRTWLAANVERYGYGFFPGGDPRDFHLDPECSTPEEREAHRLACERAEAAASTPADTAPAGGVVETQAADGTRGVACWDGGGLGVYTIREPELEALLALVTAALDAGGAR